MRRFRQVIIVVLLGVLGFGFWVFYVLPRWASVAKPITEPRVVHLDRGMKLAEFAAQLETEGLIDKAISFRLWVKFHRNYNRFQAGTYRFEKASSPAEIAATVESGKNWVPFVLQYVIPEGFTLKQVIERLEARRVGTKAELESVAKSPELRAQFGIKGSNVEGYIYPATYSFVSMPTPKEAFTKMLQTFFAALPPGIEEQLQSKRLSLHEAIVFASLVERETQIDEERPLVAEVIWNRLKSGEPLGIDAALIYGISNYKGDITWQHLRDSKNPYNNRIHKGLPPTPIGAISMESLLAVLTPAQEGNLFYVLRNDGSHRHHFTKTLAEHNVFVKQLIESSRKN